MAKEKAIIGLVAVGIVVAVVIALIASSLHRLDSFEGEKKPIILLLVVHLIKGGKGLYHTLCL